MNCMRKTLKKCAALVFGVLFSATTLGAVSRHVTFLQYYEQMDNYAGQDGIYFVSEAASSSASGRGGDPTVQKGWAMYVYQGTQATAGSGVARGGWRKICEGESLDSSVNELLLRNYVSMHVRQSDLNTIAETYETKVAHDTEVEIGRAHV